MHTSLYEYRTGLRTIVSYDVVSTSYDPNDRAISDQRRKVVVFHYDFGTVPEPLSRSYRFRPFSCVCVFPDVYQVMPTRLTNSSKRGGVSGFMRSAFFDLKLKSRIEEADHSIRRGLRCLTDGCPSKLTCPIIYKKEVTTKKGTLMIIWVLLRAPPLNVQQSH
jgi:hypothetical protein